MKNKATSKAERNIIKGILDEIKEINYKVGLKNAMGNIDNYLQMLRLAIKDIQICINSLSKSSNSNIISELTICIHNLKSVFSSIGAIALLEEANYIEKIIEQQDRGFINTQVSWFINHINDFNVRIKRAILKYASMFLKDEVIRVENTTIMSEEEYEQRINNTIYYIKRFEFDAILIELDKLINMQNLDRKSELIKIKDDIKEFEYDKALTRILMLRPDKREE